MACEIKECASASCVLEQGRIMSGQPASVSDCIDAVCSVYYDACLLVDHIKAEKKGCSPSAQELEASLIQGRSAIRVQYEQIEKRPGKSSANSDRMSTSCLILVALVSMLIHRRGSSRCPKGHICPFAWRGGSHSAGTSRAQ